MEQRRSRVFLLLMTCVAALAVLATIAMTPGDAGRTAGRSLNGNPRPWDSISGLVANRSAIVIATVDGTVAETTEAEPGPPGGTPTGLPTLPPQMATIVADMSQLPVTDYAAVSYETLYHDGDLPTGEPFHLRMLGHPSELTSTEIAERYPSSGQRYLVFLDRVDSDTYGLIYGGMFVVGASAITWPNGDPFSLAAGMSSLEFLDAIRDEVEVQYGQ